MHDMQTGRIEVICGPMFSGKTEELLRRIKRCRIAKLKVGVFKPSVDHRFSSTDIVSHNFNQLKSNSINQSDELLKAGEPYDIIAIDEGQFFDHSLICISEQLALMNKRVIVAGLDMDFKGNPFGPIPHIMARADYITKLNSICVDCGNYAIFTHRKSNAKGQIVIGEKDHYKPLCRTCFSDQNEDYQIKD